MWNDKFILKKFKIEFDFLILKRNIKEFFSCNETIFNALGLPLSENFVLLLHKSTEHI